ncbi:DUF2750 domain-containing protein [Parasalinivibrio latis]|uniref:DUF2750 domain-containing protein n=1 Tax=Parasalinivibrio latis TaxID=2952610 RepID=UPI0030E22979
MSKPVSEFQGNIDKFVAESRETGLVWGLCQDEIDWLSMDSSEFEGAEVMPFWSNEADARQHCEEEWSDFEPVSIPFDMFINEWLMTLAEDGVLVGLNWNAELEGEELEPETVAKLFS